MAISLSTQLANGKGLLLQNSSAMGVVFTQLHVDIINSSPTALALYESAARNNVPITIGAPKPDGTGGTYYDPTPDLENNAPNGTIVIDARDFSAQTKPLVDWYADWGRSIQEFHICVVRFCNATSRRGI